MLVILLVRIDLITTGGNINVNTMLVVSTIISSNQAIISPCSWSSGCLGSFTITNIVGGGVEMISQSVFSLMVIII